MSCAYWCTMYLYNILRGSIDCASHWENWRFACIGPWLMRPSKYQRWHSYIFKISLRLIRLETPTNAISCLTFHIRHSFFLRLLRRFCCPPRDIERDANQQRCIWKLRFPTGETLIHHAAAAAGRNGFFFSPSTTHGGSSVRPCSEMLNLANSSNMRHREKTKLFPKEAILGPRVVDIYIYIYAVYIYMAYFVNMLSKYQ